MIESIIILVLSLFGLVFGTLLAYLTPEELSQGKKYIYLVKRIIQIIIYLIISYFLIIEKNYLLVILFLIIVSVLFFIEVKKLDLKMLIFQESVNYLIFIIYFFIISNQQLLLASLIFLYGIPTGTLLKNE